MEKVKVIFTKDKGSYKAGDVAAFSKGDADSLIARLLASPFDSTTEKTNPTKKKGA